MIRPSLRAKSWYDYRKRI